MGSHRKDYPKVSIVYKVQPAFEGSTVEFKSILFASEDHILAQREIDRLNSELSQYERHTLHVQYKVEMVPMISTRKTRHPFMRGQHQHVLFDPEVYDKDGNR